MLGLVSAVKEFGFCLNFSKKILVWSFNVIHCIS